MFLWLTYPLKVNAALTLMGLPPNKVDSTWRSGMQEIGMEGGLTPQETAVVIVGFVFENKISYPDNVELCIGNWKHDLKLDTAKSVVRDALIKLGFGHF